MKLLVVLLGCFVAINALSNERAQWLQFKAQHLKMYKSLEEDRLRFQIFQNNLNRIEEHNALYEKGEVSYFFKVTKFADLTPEEFEALMNKQIASKPSFNTTRFVPDESIQVDESKDWRGSAVLAVKDQGNCGSCWAFSATGALEGQLAIQKNQQTPLSEQELVDCSTDNAGCDGGLMDYAFDYIKSNGISSETAYPYKGYDQSCKSGTTRVVETISGYKDVAANENALKTAVGTVGPVSVAVNANVEWQLYGGGIFDHLLCLGGNSKNHGVLAVGYGTEKKDYWIIKNSWGSSWGEDGYIRLVRGKNQCGVDEEASYPEL